MQSKQHITLSDCYDPICLMVKYGHPVPIKYITIERFGSTNCRNNNIVILSKKVVFIFSESLIMCSENRCIWMENFQKARQSICVCCTSSCYVINNGSFCCSNAKRNQSTCAKGEVLNLFEYQAIQKATLYYNALIF